LIPILPNYYEAQGQWVIRGRRLSITSYFVNLELKNLKYYSELTNGREECKKEILTSEINPKNSVVKER